ncbi:MAG: hypothetical protein Q9218_003878, partial [Villophora microphyllina]
MRTSFNVLALLAILSTSLALPQAPAAPSLFRSVNQGSGGAFSYNGRADPNAVGTDGCGTCIGFYINVPGSDPVGYVAHADNNNPKLVPNDRNNPRYQTVVNAAMQLIKNSNVEGWDVNSARFHSLLADPGFANAVRDGVMAAIDPTAPSPAALERAIQNSVGFVIPVDANFQPMDLVDLQ